MTGPTLYRYLGDRIVQCAEGMSRLVIGGPSPARTSTLSLEELKQFPMRKSSSPCIAGLVADGWTLQNDSGQHNSGVYTKGDRIVICGKTTLDKYVEQHANVESIRNLFPMEHRILHMSGESLVEYDRLDGDVTSLFLDVIPHAVLARMGLDPNERTVMEFLFWTKQPTTGGNRPTLWPPSFKALETREGVDRFETFIKSVERGGVQPDIVKDTYYRGSRSTVFHAPDFDCETYSESPASELRGPLNRGAQYVAFMHLIESGKLDCVHEQVYDEFICLVVEEINQAYPIVVRGLITLYRELHECGFQYRDMKFDNYGYTLTNEPTPRSYDQQMFGKHLTLFFFDAESGLSLRDDDISFCPTTIEDFDNAGVNGQYNLWTLGDDIMWSHHVEGHEELVKIMQKKFTWRYTRRD